MSFWSKPLNCAFSGSKRCKFSAKPFLHCFKKFHLRLRIFFLSPITSFFDRFPAWSTAQNHNADGALSRSAMDHCGNDHSLHHTFPLAPHQPLSTPRLHFFAFLGDIAKLYRCFHHLDCVAPKIALAPCISFKRDSSTRSPYVSVIFRFQKNGQSFIRSGVFLF